LTKNNAWPQIEESTVHGDKLEVVRLSFVVIVNIRTFALIKRLSNPAITKPVHQEQVNALKHPGG